MVDLVLEHACLQARGLDLIGSPSTSRPLTRTCRGRSTSIETRGRLRQPSSARTASSESHSIEGLTRPVGALSEPAWKTSSAAQDAELGGGQADPQPVAHDRDHAVDLGPQLGAEPAHRRGLALQHRVAELDHVRQRRFAPLQHSASSCLALGFVPQGTDYRSRALIVWIARAGHPGERYWGSTSTPIATSFRERSAARRSTAARTAATVRLAVLGLDQEAAAVAVADAEHRRRAEQVGVVPAALGEPVASRWRPLRAAASGLGLSTIRTRCEKGG